MYHQFTDEETEAQRGPRVGPSPPSQEVAEPGLHSGPDLKDSKDWALTLHPHSRVGKSLYKSTWGHTMCSSEAALSQALNNLSPCHWPGASAYRHPWEWEKHHGATCQRRAPIFLGSMGPLKLSAQTSTDRGQNTLNAQTGGRWRVES